MIESLQPILALLDEGLRLYRRNFVGFVLITASWFVPVAIMSGLVAVAASWLESLWPALLTIGGLLLLFPLQIYLIGGLSRAAMAAAAGRAVRFREAMAIRPLRAVGMGCFTIFYALVAQLASLLASVACVCPLYMAGFTLLALLASSAGSGSVPALGIAALGIFLAGIFLVMMLVGATSSGLFYGLQPWVQEARPFGDSMQRSIQLIFYRFWRNLLTWLLTALLTASVGLTVMATIGVLLPLPLIYALGSASPLVRAISLGAWLLGFMVVLPPLPIWMALLYQRNRAIHEGADLQAQLQVWAQPKEVLNLQAPDIQHTILG